MTTEKIFKKKFLIMKMFLQNEIKESDWNKKQENNLLIENFYLKVLSSLLVMFLNIDWLNAKLQ